MHHTKHTETVLRGHKAHNKTDAWLF